MAAVTAPIQVHRGNFANLPSEGLVGEPIFAIDTGQLFFGTGAGNPLVEIGGGGVTDGDKGDITVSASGATWTIDAGAVTRAKLSDGAACSVIGRSANSSGVPADISLGQNGHVLQRVANVIQGAYLPGEILAESHVLADQSTTSASFVDLTTAQSVTFTLAEAANVIIQGLVNTYSATVGAFHAIAADVDGADSFLSQGTIKAINSPEMLSGAIKVSLASGSHTVKLQFGTSAGTAQFRWRSLIIWRAP